MGGGAPTLFQDDFSDGVNFTGDGVAVAGGVLTISPTQGATLVDTDDYSYESGIGNWNAYGTNVLASSTDKAQAGTHSLKITYADDVRGGYLYFQDASCLSEDLTDGNWYIIQFYIAVSAGSVGTEIRNTALGTIDGPLTTSATMELVEISIIKGAGSIPFIRLNSLGAGESFYFDALAVLPLSDIFALRDQAFVNAYVQAEITRATYTLAGVVHYADADNFVIAYLNGDDKVKLVKCVAGAYTEVASVNVTYGAGNVLQISRSGTNYTVTYNAVEVISATAITDGVFGNAKTWGVFSTHAANTFDDYEWRVN